MFAVWSAIWACVDKPERADGSSGTDDSAEESDGSSTEPEWPPTEATLIDIGRTGVTDPNEQIPAPDNEGCHAIYAQDNLPVFELTVDPKVWNSLVWEWNNGAKNEELGIETDPYHPLAEFRYGNVVINDAMIRLRGNPTWWNVDDKMQFQIGFDKYDDDGHFLGLKKIAFDAATYNRHMLRDRLALQIMRDMGITAPCANNARVYVNGAYYGIFTNLEKIDEIFLQRAFDDPTGDLWKRANWELETNKKTANDMRLKALRNADTVAELESYLDVEQALRVFAAEAIIPDSDGMWAGGLNFYVYDEPVGDKFVMLPWDLDNTFERFNDPPDGEYPTNPDPIVWEKPTTHGRPFYTLAMTDPDWFNYYIEVVGEQVESGYQIDVLHERIDTWSAQIHDAVLDDINKPYSNKLYLSKVEELHEYVDTRHSYLVDWLDCWEDGGVADGEGYCELP